MVYRALLGTLWTIGGLTVAYGGYFVPLGATGDEPLSTPYGLIWDSQALPLRVSYRPILGILSVLPLVDP